MQDVEKAKESSEGADFVEASMQGDHEVDRFFRFVHTREHGG